MPIIAADLTSNHGNGSLRAMTGWFHPEFLLLALIIDAVMGDPTWLYRHVQHPVQIMGTLIGRGERWLNQTRFSPRRRKILGVSVVIVLLILAVAAGWALHYLTSLVRYGWIAESMLAATLLAQRSLFDHVLAVYRPLRKGDLVTARGAVSQIVGRDPENLDEAGISRASIESLAENFSDGVVAPAFWYLIAGLPGIIAYKMINTADSMIGHKSDRYRDFGWASARLDDLVNLIPARLSGLLLVLAAAYRLQMLPAMKTMLRDARHHRSPNAGWPEAAMAGALSIALAGPRRYGGTMVHDHWMGNGNRTTANAADIRHALTLYLIAAVLQAAIIAGLAAMKYWPAHA